MSGSTNVNLRGDQGQFAHMSPLGDVNTQVAYKQHKPVGALLMSGTTQGLDNLPSPGILLHADPSNQGPIFVGGVGPDSAVIDPTLTGGGHGHPLWPGVSWVDPVNNANLITVAGTKNDILWVSGWLNQSTDVTIAPPTGGAKMPPILIASVPINNSVGVTNLASMNALFSQSLDPTTVFPGSDISISPTLPIFDPAIDGTNPAKIDISLNPVVSFLAMGSTYIDATANSLLKVGQTSGSQASYISWFRMGSNPAANAGIMSMGSAGMQPYVDTSGIFHCDFNYNTHAIYKASSGIVVTDDKWHFMVVSNNGTGDSQVFLDGSLLIDTPAGDFLSASGTAHMFIGATYASQFWDMGEISDTAVYNVQLTLAEMQSLYVHGNISRGLVAEWDMHEGTGTTTTDIVNSIVGTFTNSPQWIPSSLTAGTKYTITYGTEIASLVGGFTNAGNQTVIFTTAS